MVGESRAERVLYTLSKQTLDATLRASKSLFDWVSPDLPEDLHLLRSDESVVLGVVANEQDAWLELDDFDLAHLRKSVPELISLLGSPRRTGEGGSGSR